MFANEIAFCWWAPLFFSHNRISCRHWILEVFLIKRFCRVFCTVQLVTINFHKFDWDGAFASASLVCAIIASIIITIIGTVRGTTKIILLKTNFEKKKLTQHQYRVHLRTLQGWTVCLVPLLLVRRHPTTNLPNREDFPLTPLNIFYNMNNTINHNINTMKHNMKYYNQYYEA